MWKWRHHTEDKHRKIFLEVISWISSVSESCTSPISSHPCQCRDSVTLLDLKADSWERMDFQSVLMFPCFKFLSFVLEDDLYRGGNCPWCSQWLKELCVSLFYCSFFGYGFKYLEDSLQLINTTQDPSSSFPPYLIVKKNWTNLTWIIRSSLFQLLKLIFSYFHAISTGEFIHIWHHKCKCYEIYRLKK